MAEETLVKEPLTKEMIEAGKALNKRLANAHVKLVSAFWLYSSETNEWEFVIALPEVDTAGPQKVYGTIVSNLYPPEGFSQLPPDQTLLEPLYPRRIIVLSPNHPLVRSLQSAIQFQTKADGVQFTRSQINDVFVEDVYVYRIN